MDMLVLLDVVVEVLGLYWADNKHWFKNGENTDFCYKFLILHIPFLSV
jgi:hypothetical protein